MISNVRKQSFVSAVSKSNAPTSQFPLTPKKIYLRGDVDGSSPLTAEESAVGPEAEASQV